MAKRSEGSPRGPLVVDGTRWRLAAGGDYLVQVNQQLTAWVGHHAIVSNNVPDTADITTRAVLAKVALDADLGDNEIRVDETLRGALLIELGAEVYLYRVTGGFRPERFLEWVFRPKRLWAYGYRSFPRDMEKGICGIDETTRRILGLEHRDRLKVASVLFNPGDERFIVGEATPTLLELSASDMALTFRQIGDFIESVEEGQEGQGRETGSPFGSMQWTHDPSMLRLPVIRLDLDTRLILADSESGEKRLQTDSASTGLPFRELPLLAPVRLSVSLPFFLQARASFYAASLFLVIPGIVIGLAQLNMFAAAVAGIAGFLGLLPFSIFWDIRRIRRKLS